jgi:hypothetical protein
MPFGLALTAQKEGDDSSCGENKERGAHDLYDCSIPSECVQEHQHARRHKGRYPKRVDVQPGSTQEPSSRRGSLLLQSWM